jgi:hypothetical protein
MLDFKQEQQRWYKKNNQKEVIINSCIKNY